MANKTTPNYGLKKPDVDDFYDVNVFNENTEKIDVQLKANAEGLAGKADLVDGKVPSTQLPPSQEIVDATTMQKGIVRLEDSVDSTSILTAATPNSVKLVYDATLLTQALAGDAYALAAMASSRMVGYFSAGTYTWEKPDGVNVVKVFMIGGGAGGNYGGTGRYTSDSWWQRLGGSGGNGGGSGLIQEGLIDVSAVSSVTVIVGAGGNGGKASQKGVGSAVAGAGGVSSFGTYLAANGGSGANGGSSGGGGYGYGGASAYSGNIYAITIGAGGKGGSGSEGTKGTGTLQQTAGGATSNVGGSGGTSIRPFDFRCGKGGNGGAAGGAGGGGGGGAGYSGDGGNGGNGGSNGDNATAGANGTGFGSGGGGGGGGAGSQTPIYSVYGYDGKDGGNGSDGCVIIIW